MKDRLGVLSRYAITLGVCILLCLLLLLFFGFLSLSDIGLRYKALSDAFFAVGVVTVMSGVLSYIERLGVFDALSYSLFRLFRGLTFDGGGFNESFYDYKIRRAKKRRGKRYGAELVLGAGFTVLASLFALLFYTV